MSDFLDRMASRSQGVAPVLRPRLLSLYEGGPALFEEVHEEREAGVPTGAAPVRSVRRPARPEPAETRAVAQAGPLTESWAEAPLERLQRPPAPIRSGPAPDEPIPNPFPAVPGEAAAPAAERVATAAAPTAAAPISAAIVRRRAAEVAAGPADPGEPAPFADPAGAFRLDPDPEPFRSATADAAAPARPQVATRRGDAGAGSVPPFAPAAPAAPVAAEGAPASADREAVAEIASTSRPAAPREAAPPVIPTRAVAPGESRTTPALATPPGVVPPAPRAESAQAPAPVEIRIGRIDIHAAPPAVPAPPVAAPGPSLDAFLARPRR